ncbi:MAG: PspA/IM30 family protein [Methylobacterium sp.]|uniref:PspA/IM30 family protein n=1 Tax=Methylobacterium sp. TaxID=409 RepID=UPI0025F8CB5C|nr:PspA/IM30 family protein [Methylobacterium sp.]MBX9930304.1 PspA/IM30 family protein [Methylobacterium sp.]
MFKLFKILARGAAAQAEEELFDRHALLVLDQQIRETRASLERSKLALATAIAGDRAEARRLAEVTARGSDLEDRAVAALSGGREDLATEAADAIAELESEAESIRAARLRFGTEIGRLRHVVADATRRQAELERGRRIAAAAEAVRRLGAAAPTSDRATLREAEATLERLRRNQSEAADLEEARTEIEPGQDIKDRLEREGFGAKSRPNAADILARLKSKVATATA